MNSLTRYLEVRSQIKTGDPILWSGKGTASLFVKWWTSSKFSHISTVLLKKNYYLRDRIFIAEAVNNGYVENGLSRRISTYKGEVYWAPLIDELQEFRPFIEANHLMYIGEEMDYDWKGCIFGNIYKRAKLDDKKLFCSEAWYICLKLGVDLYEKYYSKRNTELLDLIKNKIIKADKYLDGEAPQPKDIPNLGFTKSIVRLV